MARDTFSDLLAFLAVARAGSFTKAAGQLGVSQSALSHTIRGLETRLGVRLLMRTTRSVSPTEAGERMLRNLGPKFDDIEAEIAALNAYRDSPSGLVRITAAEHAANTIVWPKLARFLPQYPDIKVEVNIDYSLTDIVAERYDMGVRLGDQVAKGMIAARIGPDVRMAVVGTPAYFASRPAPLRPQHLLEHNCINLRLPTLGGLYAWEFDRDGEQIRVRVDGQLILNGSRAILQAVLDGFGLGYLPEDMVDGHLRNGALVRVLEDWCSRFPGYHLYYPSRKQSSLAHRLVVDALRHDD